MKNFIVFFTLILFLSGCEFNKSFNADLTTGIITKGNGISVENCYITIGDGKISRKTFLFGEKFFLNFNNVEGLKKEEEKVFPGMKIFVVNNSGDTVMRSEDLYTEYDNAGISLSPLLLVANLSIGAPMKSGNEYTLKVSIWDKKGSGTFSADFKFTIESNNLITVNKNKVNCNEVYLFSKENKKVIKESFKSDETVYMLFEGVTGFSETNGMIFPGLSLKVADGNGQTLLEKDDLFEENSDKGFSVTDLKELVSANFNLSNKNYKGIVIFEVTLWDKKSDAKITASAKLKAE